MKKVSKARAKKLKENLGLSVEGFLENAKLGKSELQVRTTAIGGNHAKD